MPDLLVMEAGQIVFSIDVLYLSQQFQRLRHRFHLLDGELQLVVDLLECSALRMVHDVLHDLHVSAAFVVFRGLVADEIGRHVVVTQQDLFEAKVLGDPA